jgi:hypothetical protein
MICAPCCKPWRPTAAELTGDLRAVAERMLLAQIKAC